MERIKLSKGLIALGGEIKVGKTRFALKFANHLAKKEKVLFISYQDYKERLWKMLEDMNDIPEKKLEINTSFEKLRVWSFLEMIDYIKRNEFTTVFIDDVDGFNPRGDEDFGEVERIATIDALHFLAEHLKIRIILTVCLSYYLVLYNTNKPELRKFFNWSVNIVNTCSQIYGFYRPAAYDLREDECGNSIVDRIELISLKNEEHQEETIVFDDSLLNIYSKQSN